MRGAAQVELKAKRGTDDVASAFEKCPDAPLENTGEVHPHGELEQEDSSDNVGYGDPAFTELALARQGDNDDLHNHNSRDEQEPIGRAEGSISAQLLRKAVKMRSGIMERL